MALDRNSRIIVIPPVFFLRDTVTQYISGKHICRDIQHIIGTDIRRTNFGIKIYKEINYGFGIINAQVRITLCIGYAAYIHGCAGTDINIFTVDSGLCFTADICLNRFAYIRNGIRSVAADGLIHIAVNIHQNTAFALCLDVNGTGIFTEDIQSLDHTAFRNIHLCHGHKLAGAGGIGRTVNPGINGYIQIEIDHLIARVFGTQLGININITKLGNQAAINIHKRIAEEDNVGLRIAKIIEVRAVGIHVGLKILICLSLNQDISDCIDHASSPYIRCLILHVDLGIAGSTTKATDGRIIHDDFTGNLIVGRQFCITGRIHLSIEDNFRLDLIYPNVKLIILEGDCTDTERRTCRICFQRDISFRIENNIFCSRPDGSGVDNHLGQLFHNLCNSKDAVHTDDGAAEERHAAHCNNVTVLSCSSYLYRATGNVSIIDKHTGIELAYLSLSDSNSRIDAGKLKGQSLGNGIDCKICAVRLCCDSFLRRKLCIIQNNLVYSGHICVGRVNIAACNLDAYAGVGASLGFGRKFVGSAKYLNFTACVHSDTVNSDGLFQSHLRICNICGEAETGNIDSCTIDVCMSNTVAAVCLYQQIICQRQLAAAFQGSKGFGCSPCNCQVHIEASQAEIVLACAGSQVCLRICGVIGLNCCIGCRNLTQDPKDALECALSIGHIHKDRTAEFAIRLVQSLGLGIGLAAAFDVDVAVDSAIVKNCSCNALTETVSNSHIGAGIKDAAAVGNQLCMAGANCGTIIQLGNYGNTAGIAEACNVSFGKLLDTQQRYCRCTGSIDKTEGHIVNFSKCGCSRFRLNIHTALERTLGQNLCFVACIDIRNGCVQANTDAAQTAGNSGSGGIKAVVNNLIVIVDIGRKDPDRSSGTCHSLSKFQISQVLSIQTNVAGAEANCHTAYRTRSQSCRGVRIHSGTDCYITIRNSEGHIDDGCGCIYVVEDQKHIAAYTNSTANKGDHRGFCSSRNVVADFYVVGIAGNIEAACAVTQNLCQNHSILIDHSCIETHCHSTQREAYDKAFCTGIDCRIYINTTGNIVLAIAQFRLGSTAVGNHSHTTIDTNGAAGKAHGICLCGIGHIAVHIELFCFDGAAVDNTCFGIGIEGNHGNTGGNTCFTANSNRTGNSQNVVIIGFCLDFDLVCFTGHAIHLGYRAGCHVHHSNTGRHACSTTKANGNGNHTDGVADKDGVFGKDGCHRRCGIAGFFGIFGLNINFSVDILQNASSMGTVNGFIAAARGCTNSNISTVHKRTVMDFCLNIAVSNHNGYAHIHACGACNGSRSSDNVHIELFISLYKSRTTDVDFTTAANKGIDDVSVVAFRFCHTQFRTLGIGDILREVLTGVGSGSVILVEVITAVIISTGVVTLIVAHIQVGCFVLISFKIFRRIDLVQIILGCIGGSGLHIVHEVNGLKAMVNTIGRILIQLATDDGHHDSNTDTSSSACGHTACVIADISVREGLHSQCSTLNGGVITDVSKDSILCYGNYGGNADTIGTAGEAYCISQQIIDIRRNDRNRICIYRAVPINECLRCGTCDNDVHKTADCSAAKRSRYTNTMRVDICSGGSQDTQISTVDCRALCNKGCGGALVVGNQCRATDSSAT